MIATASTLGPSAYWYLTRATGAVALLLLTGSVVLGLVGSARLSARRWPRFAIDTLHRDVSLLVIVLLVLHVVTTVLDGFAPITLLDGVIPFLSPYRPLWLGLGTLSFDLLLAIVVTSLLRRRLGYRSWRAIHWLSYLSWPVAVLHGLGTGTDVRQWWLLLLTVACVVAVLVAVLVRLGAVDSGRGGIRGSAAALSVITPLGIAIFAVVGPLQHGWARRAGTPARLLGAGSAATSASTAGSRQSAPQRAATRTVARPFTDRLSGKLLQWPQPAGAIVELRLTLRGQVPGVLRVRMGGQPLPQGGLSMTGSQVDLSATGTRYAFQGRILTLQGDRFVARVSDHAGTVLELRANLDINPQTAAVGGTLSGAPLVAGG